MELLAKKRIGALGRLLLPSNIRQDFNLNTGTDVGIYVDENRNLILKSFSQEQVCSFCNKPAEIKLNNRGVCNNCIKQINKRGAMELCKR